MNVLDVMTIIFITLLWLLVLCEVLTFISKSIVVCIDVILKRIENK